MSTFTSTPTTVSTAAAAAARPFADDKVINPNHYQLPIIKASGQMLEVIDVVEAANLNFRLGNALTYILRAGKKTAAVEEDLQKAIWYLDRELRALNRQKLCSLREGSYDIKS
jgi:Protein of unknwon function (DUF3310)